MCEPAVLGRLIVSLIERARIDISTEAAAHRAIGDTLERAGLDVQREVRLTERDRIDLMVGAVGIEVKVGHSRRRISEQLERYAALSQVQALVLATGTAWPGGTDKIAGKRFFVASLTRGWL